MSFTKLTLEDQQKVDAHIGLYVKYNAGKSVPTWRLAEECGVSQGSVSVRIKKMVDAGELVKVTHKTYALPDAPEPQSQGQMSLVPPTTKTKRPDAFMQRLQQLYFEYTLVHQQDSVRSFMQFVNEQYQK